jgi:hypothetical protein
MIKHRRKFVILSGLIMFSLGILLGMGNSADDLAKGALVYQANCIACHGENGNGNGPESSGFTPAPTDFTSSQMASVTTVELEKAIVEGVPGVDQHSWSRVLSKEDVDGHHLYKIISAIRADKPKEVVN